MRLRRMPAVGVFFSLLALETLATVVYQLSMPADPANTLWLGYSLRRLVVIALVLAGGLAALALAWKGWRDASWGERLLGRISLSRFNTALLAGLALFFFICWGLAWTEPYLFKQYDLFFKGLRPVIVLLALASAETVLMLLVRRFGFAPRRLLAGLSVDRSARAGLLFLGLILLLWAFIAVTGLGLAPDTAYWNSTGVPVLAWQALLAWMGGMAALLIDLRRQQKTTAPAQGGKTWVIDLALCLLLFLLSATLWANEPQVRSFFAPGPYPPNQAFYPLSDAAGYDIAAQFALIGQRLDNGHHVDKPLYSTLLFFLHLLGGQNFATLVALQAVFLALLPVLLYLLGRSLHSRAAGIVAGLLGMFKGWNAIASAWMVLSANPKLLISEYPLALALAALTLFLALWLKDTRQNTLYAMLCGGMLGLSTMIRHNVWVLLPLALLLAWAAAPRRWRDWLRSSALFLAMFVLSIAPWMWRSYQETGSPLFFAPMVENVIFKTRYLPVWPTPDPYAAPISGIVSNPQPTRTPTPVTQSVATPNVETQHAASLRLDDADNAIVYGDGWLHARDAGVLDGSLHYAIIPGDTASLTFSGQRLTLLYKRHPQYGRMSVSIDGQLADVIDQSGPEERQVQWQSAGLTPGRHRLEVAPQGDAPVTLDALQIDVPAGPRPYTLQTSAGCPALAEGWISADVDPWLRKDEQAIPVKLPFPILFNQRPRAALTVSANGWIAFDPDTLNATGVGLPAADLLAPYWSDLDPSAGGIITYGTFGIPPQRRFVIEWRAVPLKSGGAATFEVILQEGTDEIIFRYGDIPAAPPAGVGIGLEGIEGGLTYSGTLHPGLALRFSPQPGDCKTTPPPQLELLDKGVYDDSDARIQYDPAWALQRWTGDKQYQRTSRYTLTPGAAAALRFTGSRVGIVYIKSKGSGVMDVEIDGQPVARIDQAAGAQTQWLQEWHSPALPPGEHTLLLRQAGQPGARIDLDAILVGEVALPPITPNPQAQAKPPEAAKPDLGFTSPARFVPAHFLHNLVTTVLLPPLSLANNDLQHTLQDAASPWEESWRGALSLPAFLLLCLNLLLLAAGLGAAWARWRWAGLAPLVVYLGYNLGTALARTSGGRYIVPVDWVVLLYYALGMIQLSAISFQQSAVSSQRSAVSSQPSGGPSSVVSGLSSVTSGPSSIVRGLLVSLFLLLLGCAPLLADNLLPRRYPTLDKAEQLLLLYEHGSAQKLGYAAGALADFVRDENSFAWMGRALYPVFYKANEGEPADSIYRYMPFSRLVFTMVTPNADFKINGGRATSAVLPMPAAPAYFPHGIDVVAFGCNGPMDNILAVALLDGEGAVYTRHPAEPLKCE